MRLIDADKLLDVLADYCPQIPNDKVDIHAVGMYHQYQHDTYMIVNAPTIDAVEQKHGHFIQGEFISTLGMCSVCEHPIDDGDRYCKWCGANMDEVTE